MDGNKSHCRPATPPSPARRYRRRQPRHSAIASARSDAFVASGASPDLACSLTLLTAASFRLIRWAVPRFR